MDKYLSQISGWNDHDDATEKRFEFLFSNLPAERTALNCYSYDEKLAFWKMHLIETSKLGLLRGDNLFQIELSSAISRFSRNGLYPGCMKTVFESLENEGIIQHSDTWKRRLVRHGLAMRMVMLAADQVITAGRKMFGKARTLLFPFSDNGRPGLNPLGPDNDYILVEFLKNLSLRAVKKLTGQAAIYTQRLSSAKEFAEALSLCYEEERYNVFKKYFCNSGDTSNTPCEHGVLSDRDVLIGLLHAREAGYIDFLAEVGYSDSIDRRGFMDTPVKIILDMSDPYSKINNRITSADLRIMDIKNKRQILAERLDFFKKRIASLRVEAKSNVALGKRESAISILREVALLSKMTITISFSLSNIDAILMSINTLETNSTIVDAYRSGAEGLRGLKKIFNISMDSIEESIEAFNTALEENHEITSAIEYGIQDTVGNSYYGASISDEDIERELNVLAEDKRQVPCAENEKPMAHSEHAGYTDILSEQLGELTLRDSGSAAHERGQEGDIIVE